jgi:exodeoxyribonuclease VII small subunit
MSKDFESAFKQLSTLIDAMEKGGLSLNDSLKQFEKGVSLIRDCQMLLKKAEQKIELYRKNKGNLEPFSSSDESD